MPSNVMQHFTKLCEIPHCSYESQEMKTYLVEQSQSFGYEVSVDAVGNILATKEGSKVTLQSHYDMVCINATFPLDLYEESGWLFAKGSTLGADNGIGMAMMLQQMQEGALVDCLFTADEEVGLLGARGLNLQLKTPYLLNLDSEDEGDVTIGCAGGVDIIATLPLVRETKRLHVYRYVIDGLAGGHSGVDIDKAIPNAISIAFETLASSQAYLINVEGGERRNSIPKRAEVHFGVEDLFEHDGYTYLGEQEVAVMRESTSIISTLKAFETGVREMSSLLDMVQTSINLALVSSDDETLRVQLSGRSMDRDDLIALERESTRYFEKEGFSVQCEGFYAPWRPEENTFTDLILQESQKIFEKSQISAIHAGLECGIIKEKNTMMQMASIGPNIAYPHSSRECVELASVTRVEQLLHHILERVNA